MVAIVQKGLYKRLIYQLSSAHCGKNKESLVVLMVTVMDEQIRETKNLGITSLKLGVNGKAKNLQPVSQNSVA